MSNSTPSSFGNIKSDPKSHQLIVFASEDNWADDDRLLAAFVTLREIHRPLFITRGSNASERRARELWVGMYGEHAAVPLPDIQVFDDPTPVQALEANEQACDWLSDQISNPTAVMVMVAAKGEPSTERAIADQSVYEWSPLYLATSLSVVHNVAHVVLYQV